MNTWLHNTSGIEVIGWLIFAAYLAIAAMAWRTSLVIRQDPDQEHIRRRIAVWQFMALFLLALALNKQLDLHGRVFVFLRDWAEMMGVESSARHTLRLYLVLGMTGGMVVVALGFLGILGVGTPRLRLGLIGVLVLLLSLVLRMLTLRAFGQMTGWNLTGWSYNWLVESIGLGLIAWSAARTIRQVQINRHAHNLIAVI